MANWWKHVNHGEVESSGPDEDQQIEKFNQAASRIFKALPKSERRTFFDLLNATAELHTFEGYRCASIGYKHGA